MKTKEIKKVSKKIVNEITETNSFSIITEISFKTGICVEITDKNGYSLYEDAQQKKECLPSRHSSYYKYLFIRENNDNKIYHLTNPNFNNKTIIYSTKINENMYLFLNTSLAPIDSTVKILISQLIYVTIGVLVVSLILAYFISRKITSPLVKINDSIKKMASGNYDIYFDEKSDIEEISNLAKTLNYATLEMSKTDELRRDLMANVSHDLKTPLTMIKAYAEMVRDLTYKNKEKREKNLNTIIEEVDRLNLLVNDILELSSLESKAITLKIETFDLTEMIRNIINRYQILVTNESFNFVFEEKKEVVVKADYKKMEQVIYNLINNAINYTGNDKKVIIGYLFTNNKVRVEIKDTGKGINSKDIKSIWDKYYRSDKNHQRSVVGTGLGLSIVKNILEMHNFYYGVKSSKKGTTFYFDIEIEP